MRKNKVVVITGSGHGIGAETAKLFATNGFSVCINYLNNEPQAIETRSCILNLGVDCIAVKADVSNYIDVSRLFNTADRKLGKLSVLVNAAGTFSNSSKFNEISERRFKESMDTNALSSFLCSKEAIKRMSIQCGGAGGSIVNVSAFIPPFGMPKYGIDFIASKGAMDSLTKSLANEVASDGIRVNSVRPGYICMKTNTLTKENGEGDNFYSTIPLSRRGYTTEVAEAIYWLASDKSSYISGKFIDISGGL